MLADRKGSYAKRVPEPLFDLLKLEHVKDLRVLSCVSSMTLSTLGKPCSGLARSECWHPWTQSADSVHSQAAPSELGFTCWSVMVFWQSASAFSLSVNRFFTFWSSRFCGASSVSTAFEVLAIFLSVATEEAPGYLTAAGLALDLASSARIWASSLGDGGDIFDVLVVSKCRSIVIQPGAEKIMKRPFTTMAT